MHLGSYGRDVLMFVLISTPRSLPAWREKRGSGEGSERGECDSMGRDEGDRDGCVRVAVDVGG